MTGGISTVQEWAIPAEAQPRPEALAYDLEAALAAVVTLRAEVPEDAFTAPILGTQRAGNGILIDESGLVLTVGYLVTEAETIWLSTCRQTVAPGHVLAYDFATGFGLVQVLGRLEVPAIPMGSTASLHVGDPVVMAAGGGRKGALSARLVGKREFAGYWEYLLDEALFTMPAHPHWGGAACIDREGRLVGVGSLLVQEAMLQGQAAPGNMAIPIDLLPPILDDLLKRGRSSLPPRPWLGFYLGEADGGVVVTGIARGAPAHKAGVEPGDVIIEVGDMPIGGLADLYHQLWSLGEAGVTVPLTVLHDGRARHLSLRSSDRGSFLKKPRQH
jgi:S1-C subfamily serine protease